MIRMHSSVQRIALKFYFSKKLKFSERSEFTNSRKNKVEIIFITRNTPVKILRGNNLCRDVVVNFSGKNLNRNHRNRNRKTRSVVAYRTNFPRDDYDIETYTILYSVDSSVQLVLRNYSFLLALLSLSWKHALPLSLICANVILNKARWILMYVHNSYQIRKKLLFCTMHDHC